LGYRLGVEEFTCRTCGLEFGSDIEPVVAVSEAGLWKFCSERCKNQWVAEGSNPYSTHARLTLARVVAWICLAIAIAAAIATLGAVLNGDGLIENPSGY